MPYACFYDVPGDEHVYKKVKAEIGEDQPDGLILQLVSKLDSGGLRHITVWESKQEWERFQQELVAPAVDRVLAGMGISDAPPRPPVTEMDLVDVITSSRVLEA
jgi:hypothetical protein